MLIYLQKLVNEATGLKTIICTNAEAGEVQLNEFAYIDSLYSGGIGGSFADEDNKRINIHLICRVDVRNKAERVIKEGDVEDNIHNIYERLLSSNYRLANFVYTIDYGSMVSNEINARITINLIKGVCI